VTIASLMWRMTLFPEGIRPLSPATGLSAPVISQSGQWTCTKAVVKTQETTLLTSKCEEVWEVQI
jgi:hypothetical protein